MNPEPHDPAPECDAHHCYSCHVDEPIPPPSKRRPGATVCGECFHYYPSGEALLEEYHRGAAEVAAAHPEWGPVTLHTNAADIHFCPLCLHDF